MFSILVHKYVHEQNYNAYCPMPIKILQRFGLLITNKHHNIHHRELDCNFAILNGFSDKFANKLIKTLDRILNIHPQEEVTDLCKKYKELYGDDITLLMTGDIKGKIVVNIKDNIITCKPLKN